MLADPCAQFHDRSGNLRVGVDVASVRRVAASQSAFGIRFEQRLFTAHEIAICGGAPERLAARFAAKEATIKALDLAEVGVDWRSIEVRSDAQARPSLRLHGAVAERARELRVAQLAVSLSHEDEHAFAAVFVLLEPAPALSKTTTHHESKSCHTLFVEASGRPPRS